MIPACDGRDDDETVEITLDETLFDEGGKSEQRSLTPHPSFDNEPKDCEPSAYEFHYLYHASVDAAAAAAAEEEEQEQDWPSDEDDCCPEAKNDRNLLEGGGLSLKLNGMVHGCNRGYQDNAMMMKNMEDRALKRPNLNARKYRLVW